MTKLNFEIDDPKFGLTKAVGFLWSDAKGIYIEYRVSDSIIELYKTEIKESFISFKEVDKVEFKNSWFSGGSVRITLSSLKKIDELPFVENAVLRLDLKRSEKEKGKDFVVNADLDLVNFRLAAMDE